MLSGEVSKAEVPKAPIPWRTIWASVVVVVATGLAMLLAYEMSRLLVWLLVSLFLAVALNPLVEFLVRRAKLRRGVAVTVVVVVALVVIVGLIVAFIRPLITEGQQFADDAPRYLRDARSGRGWVGDLIRRFHLDQRLSEQSDAIKNNLGSLASRSVSVLGAVGSAVASALTVFVVTTFLLLDAPRLTRGALALCPPRHRERIGHLGRDSSRAVTGYVAGNLIISVIAGVVAYVFLWIAGVPFKGVLALWVGFADLIPLVGATLGAVIVIAVAFVHSPEAGVASVVFFIVYQQIENHVLQPTIQGRAVKLSPLTVLVGVLAGVELAGMLGALLAIPACGVIQVVASDLWHERHPELDAPDAPGEDGEDDVDIETTEAHP